MKTDWYDATKIWWSFLWRNAIIILPTCFLTGFVLGVLGYLLDIPLEQLETFLEILGYILTFTLPIITMKWLLNKQIINIKSKE